MNEELTFRDIDDNIWDLKINLKIARFVDASDFTNYSSMEFSMVSVSREFFEEILRNPNFMVAVIWAIVQPQVKDNLGIDPKEEYEEAELAFAEKFDGDTLDNARRALLSALADFYPGQRTVLSILVRQEKKAKKIAEKHVQNLESSLEKAIKHQMSDAMKLAEKEGISLIDSGN